jgi:hypothetical protein
MPQLPEFVTKYVFAFLGGLFLLLTLTNFFKVIRLQKSGGDERLKKKRHSARSKAMLYFVFGAPMALYSYKKHWKKAPSRSGSAPLSAAMRMPSAPQPRVTQPL